MGGWGRGRGILRLGILYVHLGTMFLVHLGTRFFAIFHNDLFCASKFNIVPTMISFVLWNPVSNIRDVYYLLDVWTLVGKSHDIAAVNS